MLNRGQKFSILLLRVVTGWFIFWTGLNSISASSLVALLGPKQTFASFYSVVLDPANITYSVLVVKWLMVLVGLLLVLGILVQIVSLVGMALMLFFYFPILTLPYVVVDIHIVTAAALLVLCTTKAGEVLGVGSSFRFSRY